MDSAPAPPLLGGARTFRPLALYAGCPAAAALRLYAVWRRAARLRRRAVCPDRTGARDCHLSAGVPNRAGSALPGRAGWVGHAAAGGAAALPADPARFRLICNNGPESAAPARRRGDFFVANCRRVA